ncbi:unnamed protein product [Phytophthora fragariaefolia]|uniref:Unnamed protein product n=1 Tax=Phytophthora fragariaefolia TaxID=1490495 RepID=A0A9W6YC84_9STRA|nr:unnamed protein product [Phytophthora fragariaefolia]
MVEVLHIPGLDRRLLSVGKLAERGLNVEFQRSSCVIWGNASAIASGKKVGRPYVLDCDQEEARVVLYAGLTASVSFGTPGETDGGSVPEPFRNEDVARSGTGPHGCDGTDEDAVERYVLMFVDDFSRYVVAYFMKKKSEVASKLNEFMRFYEKCGVVERTS